MDWICGWRVWSVGSGGNVDKLEVESGEGCGVCGCWGSGLVLVVRL